MLGKKKNGRYYKSLAGSDPFFELDLHKFCSIEGRRRRRKKNEMFRILRRKTIPSTRRQSVGLYQQSQKVKKNDERRK